jgi:hypothetical protein
MTHEDNRLLASIRPHFIRCGAQSGRADAKHVKYVPSGRMNLTGSVIVQTTPYSPAIFTSANDDTVGDTGVPHTFPAPSYFAAVALQMPAHGGGSLGNLRVSYASTALSYQGYFGTPGIDTLRDVQITHCNVGVLEAGVYFGGSGTFPRTFFLGNALFSDVHYAFNGMLFGGSIQHLTVDGCNALLSGGFNPGLTIRNSVFANVLNATGSITADHNGFYNAPVFGSSAVVDASSPFAPTRPSPGYAYFANGQGAYYLRVGSPFQNCGSASIDATLRSDLARRTTFAPDLFNADVIRNITLGRRPVRGSGELPSSGWHYSAVDHVICGATVNNATLEIEPGTVLAYVWGNQLWGVRLNAGGRLIADGVPTNRVVFARAEAVQESPWLGWQLSQGAVTFNGLVVGPPFAYVTPLYIRA